MLLPAAVDDGEHPDHGVGAATEQHAPPARAHAIFPNEELSSPSPPGHMMHGTSIRGPTAT